MAFDCKGNKRGRCLVCIECEEFTPWAKNVRCAYCDCPPTKHQHFPGHELPTKDRSVSTVDGVHGDLQSREGSRFSNVSENNSTHQMHLSLVNEGSIESLSQGTSTGHGSLHKLSSTATHIKEEESTTKVVSVTHFHKCPVCKKKFKKISNLKSHILLHKGKLQFKCKKCSHFFQTLEELLGHKKHHENEDQRQGKANSLSKMLNSEENHGRKRKNLAKMTTIAPKQSSVPSYPQGINLWNAANQNAYLMSPLTGGLFPQVTMPAQILQNNSLNHTGRGFQEVQQQNTTPPQDQMDNHNNQSQKILNLLHGLDNKASSLAQIDRKLDYIIHAVSTPREPVQESPSFTVETDQVARSLEQITAQIEDPTQQSRLLTEPISEPVTFKRGSLLPGQQIPDAVVDEAFRSSVSRRNLAKNLVFIVFSADELRGRNCSGKVYGKGLPKERLNQLKLHAVKMATFRKYPCNPSEMDIIWQRECIKAIDKAIRSRALHNKL
ncbi:uncharacterized protein LOC135692134 [Rhopilema esculentum]|uniref:uncharacterized protein LOC135692134 n=1 Tax=Rhopilema esculentum TaxID=499914 RepID=UPI0031D484C2